MLRPIHFALSALGIFNCSYLGRWPRLLHFAPLALSGLSFDTPVKVLGLLLSIVGRADYICLERTLGETT